MNTQEIIEEAMEDCLMDRKSVIKIPPHDADTEIRATTSGEGGYIIPHSVLNHLLTTALTRQREEIIKKLNEYAGGFHFESWEQILNN